MHWRLRRISVSQTLTFVDTVWLLLTLIMTLENILSQIGTHTKHLTDRYSDYATGPVQDHDHQVYYAYEPSPQPHGHVATSKHNYGGGHKSGASMSALTLLAFLFFLHILQQCIKDHMIDMSTAQPVVVMTAGREGDEIIPKTVSNKIDKSGITDNDKRYAENDDVKTYQQNEEINYDKKSYDHGSSVDTEQFLKLNTTKPINKFGNQKYKYIINSNRSSYFPGFVSAMDEE